jgi:very-short-patch-repair endonuclease
MKMASEQHGVFTRDQALAAGVPRTTIDGRVTRGAYVRLHPRVLTSPGAVHTWRLRVLAAVFSATEPAAASHLTGACLWGMTSRQPKRIEIVARRHRRVERDPFVVHESKDLRLSDVVVVDGIPVTSAVRTVVDLGASASPVVVARCLDSALRRRLFTAWDVRRFIARVARSGRTGVGTIRPLIEESLTWQGLTESDLEDALRRVVEDSPYPMPGTQFVLDDRDRFVGRYDFAYPQRMALIETDSEGFHMDPVSFQRDREKQNRAQMLGWTVYRFTWRQIVEDPQFVLDVIATIFAD